MFIEMDDGEILTLNKKKVKKERYTVEDDDTPDDLGGMLVSLIKKIPFRMGFMLFIVFIILNTTPFISKFLNRWDGAVDGLGHLTETGTVVQGVILVLTYIVLDLFVTGDLI